MQILRSSPHDCNHVGVRLNPGSLNYGAGTISLYTPTSQHQFAQIPKLLYKIP